MGGVFPEGVWLWLHSFLSGGMLPNLEAAQLYDSQSTLSIPYVEKISLLKKNNFAVETNCENLTWIKTFMRQ